MQVPLGVLFRNENGDMLEILKKFQSYIPKADVNTFDNQECAGDQSWVERAVNVVASVENGHTPEDRLDELIFKLATGMLV